MATASRTRTDDELFPDTGPAPETRSTEQVQAAFDDKDYNDIAKELGACRAEVSYVIHGEGRDRHGGWPTSYRLTGTYGASEIYDVATDARAATRLTHEVMQRGAAAIAGAAGKKS